MCPIGLPLWFLYVPSNRFSMTYRASSRQLPWKCPSQFFPCLYPSWKRYPKRLRWNLEKFFDNVPQDKLMSRAHNIINVGYTESLIRKYLKAGVMVQGRYEKTDRGTPQGSLCGYWHNEPCSIHTVYQGTESGR